MYMYECIHVHVCVCNTKKVGGSGNEVKGTIHVHMCVRARATLNSWEDMCMFVCVCSTLKWCVHVCVCNI